MPPDPRLLTEACKLIVAAYAAAAAMTARDYPHASEAFTRAAAPYRRLFDASRTHQENPSQPAPRHLRSVR